MNRLEHLLTGVTEECSEVSQRVSKALRFGMQEIEPDWTLNNSQRIVQEYADLIGMMELLEEGGYISLKDLRPMIAAKKAKFEHYLKYSKSMGTLID